MSSLSIRTYVTGMAVVVTLLRAAAAQTADLQVFAGTDLTWNTVEGAVGTNTRGIGGIYYYDANSSTGWDAGEDFWVETNGNASFDYLTEVSLLGTLTGGEAGSQDGLYFADADSSGQYGVAEDIWFEIDGNGIYNPGTAQPALSGLFVAWWGSAAGDGIIEAPFRTLEEAVGSAEAGDTIRVATSLSRSYTVYADSQRYKPAESLLLYQGVTVLGGYTHDFTGRDPQAFPTIIDGQAVSPVFAVMEYDITVDGFRFENGTGTYVEIGDDMGGTVELRRNMFFDAAGTAVSFGKGAGFTVTNNIFAGNMNGVEVLATGVEAYNNTFVRNRTGVTVGMQSGVLLVNNIFAYHIDRAVYENGVYAEKMAYNAFYGNAEDCMNLTVPVALDDLGVRNSYVMNATLQPLFVDTAAYDFHLQPGSPCIDAGDSSMVYDEEPLPNGDRINLGAYGNTPYAAVSLGSTLTAAPSVEPADGRYAAPLTVTVTDNEGGAAVYYTTDGSVPDTTALAYTGPFDLPAGDWYVSAVAVAAGKAPSTVTVRSYEVDEGDEPFTADTATIALWHFDEADGDTAFDESGNGLHAYVPDVTVWLDSGYFAGGLYLDQGGQLEVNDDESDFGLWGDITYDLWVRTDNFEGTILSQGSDGAAFSVYGSDGLWVSVQDESGQRTELYMTDAPADGAWHRMKIVIDFTGDTLSCFFDDVRTAAEDMSALAPSAATGEPLYIGGAVALYLDELRVTRGARYKEPLPMPSVPAGFGEGGTTAYLVALYWDPNPVDENIVGYVLYRDGTVLDTVPGTVYAYADYGVQPNTGYTYGVEALNGEGARSGPATLDVTTPDDGSGSAMGISGRVFVAADSAVVHPSAYTVRAYREDDPAYGYSSYPDGMETGYVVDIYDPGAYRVELTFLDGPWMEAALDSLLYIGDSAFIENVDFYVFPGDSISGTVTYSEGSVENLAVMAVPADKAYDALAVRDLAYRHAYTDADGTYRIRGLAPGAYLAVAADRMGYNDIPAADRYYDGADLFRDADSVLLDGTTLFTDVDFALVPGVTMAGTLFSARDGSMTEGDVQVVDTTGYVVAAGVADVYGGYRITGLPAGTYTVYARPYNFNGGQLLPGYYGGAVDLAAAWTLTTVASRVYEGVNVTLAVDSLPPAVVAVEPSGDSLVPVAAAVVVRFSERMDAACVEQDFRFYRITDGMFYDGEKVSGSFAWEGDSVLTFRPAGGLQPASVYRYDLGGCDPAGNGLEGTRAGMLVTEGTGETDAPFVTATAPPATGQAADGPFFMAVAFNEVMDPATMRDAVAFSGGDVLAEYMPEMRLLLLRPRIPVEAGVTYTVTVDAAVRDASGNRMDGPYAWSFTPAGTDDTAPDILYSLPNDGVSGAPATDVIEVVFDEPVDLETLDSAAVTVTRTSAGATDLAWRLAEDEEDFVRASDRIVLQLDKGDVALGATYTVTFAAGAVTDLAGNAMPERSFSFAVRDDESQPAVAARYAEAEAFTDVDSVRLELEVAYDVVGGNEDTGGPYVNGATVRDLTQGTAALGLDVDENDRECRLYRAYAPGELNAGYHTLEFTLTDAAGAKTVLYARVYVFAALPQCVAPADSAETGPLPAFRWTEAPGVSWYVLYVDDSDTLTAPGQYLLFPQGGDTARFTLPSDQPLAEGAYRWAVMAGSDVASDAGRTMSAIEPFRVTGTVAVPGAVTGLAAVQSAYAVRLTWDAASPADRVAGYAVRRSADAGTTWTDAGYATSAAYVDSSIEYGLAYRYRVAAVNAAGTGAYAEAGPVTVPHGAPSSLVVTVSPDPVSVHDTAAVTVTAADAYGNTWDVGGDPGLKLFLVSAGDTAVLAAAAVVPAQEGTYGVLADLDGVLAAGSFRATVGTLTQIRVSPASAVILHDSTLAFTATGTYSTGTVLDVTDAVAWQVSDQAGKIVRGVYEPGVAGTFSVRATDPDGNVSGSATVTVKRNMPPDIALVTSFVPGGTTHSSKFSFTVTANDTDMGVSRPVDEAECRLFMNDAVRLQGSVGRGVTNVWPANGMLEPGTYVLQAKAADARGNADSVRIRVTVDTRRYTLPAERWRMVAVPHNGDDRSVTSLFGAGTDVYRWNERLENDRFTLKYEDLTTAASAVTSRFEPGYAAWVRTDAGMVVDRSVDPYFGTADTVVLQLEAGWNQVGNPFSYPIRWSSIDFGAVGGTDDAKDLPPVEPVIWRYDGKGYPDDVDQDLFEPWEGYFVKANVACRAVLTDPEPYFGTNASSLGKGAAGLAAGADWAVNVTARSGGFRDGCAVLGCRVGAVDGRDRFDVSEPMLPLDGGIRAYLVNPDVASDLAADFRPSGPDGSWILGVDVPDGEPVTLSWDRGAVTGITVLVDEKRAKAVDMAATAEYAYTPDADGSDRFTVVQGSGAPQLAAWAAAGVYVSNRPNPFRNGTVIRYRIPADNAGKDAVLRVFDAAGRPVAQMAVPACAGTLGTVIWDDPGVPGIYLYRISTDNGWYAEGRMLRSE